MAAGEVFRPLEPAPLSQVFVETSFPPIIRQQREHVGNNLLDRIALGTQWCRGLTVNVTDSRQGFVCFLLLVT